MNRSLSVTLVIAGFFLVWELGVQISGVPNYILPSPSEIALELASDPLWYARHAAYTIGSCLLGFFLALVIGVLAAIGIVYSRILENTLYTLLVSLNSIPKIALAPLFIIWMGTGAISKVAISMLIALFAIVIDTVLGLRSVDPDVLDLTKSMRATPLQVLWKVRFPTALPAMFAGMKVAISLALVGAIAGDRCLAGGARLRHPDRAGHVPDHPRVCGDRVAGRARHRPVLPGEPGRALGGAMARVAARRCHGDALIDDQAPCCR
jgi:NitT/TauT family transport system permease protein